MTSDGSQAASEGKAVLLEELEDRRSTIDRRLIGSASRTRSRELLRCYSGTQTRRLIYYTNHHQTTYNYTSAPANRRKPLPSHARAAILLSWAPEPYSGG